MTEPRRRRAVTPPAAAAVFAALGLMLAPATLRAQAFNVSVDIQGKKTPKVLEEWKEEVCQRIFAHLAYTMPQSSHSPDCTKALAKADYSIGALVVIDDAGKSIKTTVSLSEPATNTLLEKRDSAISFAAAGKDLKKAAVDEVGTMMQALIPSGWTPGGEGEEAPPAGEGGEPPPPAEPPPPEPTAVSAGLLVAVSEAGASVYIDGKTAGKTPLAVIAAIPPGRHDLKVVKEGFKKYDGDVDIPPEQVSKIYRKDIILKATHPVKKKKKKSGSVAKAWWLWTIVGVVVVGAAAGATAGVLTQDEGTSGVSFPDY